MTLYVATGGKWDAVGLHIHSRNSRNNDGNEQVFPLQFQWCDSDASSGKHNSTKPFSVNGLVNENVDTWRESGTTAPCTSSQTPSSLWACTQTSRKPFKARRAVNMVQIHRLRWSLQNTDFLSWIVWTCSVLESLSCKSYNYARFLFYYWKEKCTWLTK